MAIDIFCNDCGRHATAKVVVKRCRACAEKRKDWIRQYNATREAAGMPLIKFRNQDRVEPRADHFCIACGLYLGYVNGPIFYCSKCSPVQKTRKIRAVRSGYSLNEVAKAAHDAGMSYGQYVKEKGL